MARSSEKQTLVHRDFQFATEAELDAQIKAFQREHEAAHGELLAMDARRPLGAGKCRVSFRVRPRKR